MWTCLLFFFQRWRIHLDFRNTAELEGRSAILFEEWERRCKARSPHVARVTSNFMRHEYFCGSAASNVTNLRSIVTPACQEHHCGFRSYGEVIGEGQRLICLLLCGRDKQSASPLVGLFVSAH